jgi:hypothetical protein
LSGVLDTPQVLFYAQQLVWTNGEDTQACRRGAPLKRAVMGGFRSSKAARSIPIGDITSRSELVENLRLSPWKGAGLV